MTDVHPTPAARRPVSIDGKLWRVTELYWRLSPFDGQPVQSASPEGPWRDVEQVDGELAHNGFDASHAPAPS